MVPEDISEQREGQFLEGEVIDSAENVNTELKDEAQHNASSLNGIELLVGKRLVHPAVYPDGVAVMSVVDTPVPFYVLHLNDDTFSTTNGIPPTSTKSDSPRYENGDESVNKAMASKTGRLNFSFWRCLVHPELALNPLLSRGFLVCSITIGACEMFPFSCGSAPYDCTGVDSERMAPEVRRGTDISQSEDSSVSSHCNDSLTPVLTSVSKKVHIPNALLPFLVIGSEGKVFYRTRVITVPGAWNETVEIDIYRLSDTIQFELFDKDFGESSERLAGIHVSPGALRCNVPYSTSVEVALTLPASVSLASTIRQAEGTDKAVASASSLRLKNVDPNDFEAEKLRHVMSTLDILPAHSLRLKVSLTLTVTSVNCRTTRSIARLGAASLATSTKSNIKMDTSPPQVLIIRYLIQRLKRVVWDWTCLPLSKRIYGLRRWNRPLESGTALLLVWFCALSPTYLLPFLLLTGTLLFWSLPSILPPYPAADASVDGLSSSLVAKPSDNTGAPGIIFGPFIEDKLLMFLKQFQTLLECLVPMVDVLFAVLRDPNAKYRRHV